MANEYDDHTHGDWPSWRRLVLAKLESLENEVRRLEEKNQISATELAVLKARIALIAVIATILASPIVAWIMGKLGL